MSWKLYDEGRESQDGDIAQNLDLGFPLFEPWGGRDAAEPARFLETAHQPPPRPTPSAGGDVDSMMLYIQAIQRNDRADVQGPARVVPPSGQVNGGVAPRDSNARFVCAVPNCNKRFNQQRHLEIHVRSHTGERPFRCSYPGCEKSFSQQCNLKTHQRLHTGEKPFACNVCGKRFGQRGNLTQHKLIHQSERHFMCKLDGCTKRFVQLGNLKSHHNTTHADTVRRFTQRLQAGNVTGLEANEVEMFEYFTSLYRNSNRGIKGRGKGNKSVRGTHAFTQPPLYPRIPPLVQVVDTQVQRGMGHTVLPGPETFSEVPTLDPLHSLKQPPVPIPAATLAPNLVPNLAPNLGPNLGHNGVPHGAPHGVPSAAPPVALYQPTRQYQEPDEAALAPLGLMERWHP